MSIFKNVKKKVKYFYIKNVKRSTTLSSNVKRCQTQESTKQDCRNFAEVNALDLVLSFDS